ncbi:MAG: dockerin type I domain-containing protein [Bacteroidia bacterium]|nr:dockerin type I domain-containing protein [Bacteroidia bacterium]
MSASIHRVHLSRRTLLLAILLALGAPSLQAQDHIFSMQFVNGQTPTTQCTAWNTWRATLTPGQYLGVTIRGNANAAALTGITCSDPAMANALANAIKTGTNGTQYTSPLCNGRIWYLCDRYGGELWIDAPSLCNGSNCPSPGWIFRACITNLNWGGFNTATCGAPTQVMEIIFHRPSAPNDIGIASIDSPKDFCAGTLPVTVTMKNFGTLPVTSATVHWTLNGVPKPSFNWTGLLDTLNNTTRQTQLTLGTETFANGVPYTIKAWTSMPNNVADTVNANDTTTVTRKAAMAGTFTIGGATPNYPTVVAAVTDLVANGVCGPVVYNIRPGTYATSALLTAIAGTSTVNTVTFQSETGNKADVILTNAATTTTNNFVVNFGGAKFVTFKNLTMNATNTTYSTVVQFSGSSSDCTIDNCDLNSVAVASTGTNNAVVYSTTGTLTHNMTIKNSAIRNGSFGMYLYGSSTTSTMNNLRVENCDLTGAYYFPVYFYYLGELKFIGNRVVNNSAYATKYLGYFMYGFNTQMERNTFLSTGGSSAYGMYIYYDNYYQAGTSRFVNNTIVVRNVATAYYGINQYYNQNMLFAHNTVRVESAYASGYALYSYYGASNRYLNNIVMHGGTGFAWYVAPGSNVVESDHNNWHSTGANLAYWGGNRANLSALQTASAKDANSVSKPVSFADVSNGNLHLVAPSDDDDDLIGTMLPEVSEDIDREPRVRPYMGADEACYLIANSLTYDFVDGSGNPIGYVELPGTIGVRYRVIFPPFAATITMTANFYSVPGNQLMYSETFSANKLANQDLNGTSYFNLPASLPSGYYKVEVVFNTKNSCGYYRNYMPYPSSLLLVPLGATPCEVWPGDVNNDGVVNYTDRKDLNEYIHDANLSTQWLNGPARYRADAVQNPLTYIQWQPQASAPWFTAMGCYMDADGNGVVNNFDYLAIKLNWMKQHGGVAPRNDAGFTPTTFDMSQNFPNPFNPTTVLQYSVPEPSRVHLRVVDMLGRVVATAVDGVVEGGVHQYTFDATNLPSGQYMAIVNMTGNESGLSFSKTVKMTLNK